MVLFIWIAAGIFAVDVLAKLVLLVTNNQEPQSQTTRAIDIVLNTAVVIWAAALLS